MLGTYSASISFANTGEFEHGVTCFTLSHIYCTIFNNCSIQAKNARTTPSKPSTEVSYAAKDSICFANWFYFSHTEASKGFYGSSLRKQTPLQTNTYEQSHLMWASFLFISLLQLPCLAFVVPPAR